MSASGWMLPSVALRYATIWRQVIAPRELAATRAFVQTTGFTQDDHRWAEWTKAAETSLSGALYVWTRPMVALVDSVCAAYPMDSHVERDALLTPTGAWMFEDPMTVFMLSYVTETDPTDGVEFAMFFLWISPHPGWTGPPVSFLTWPLTQLTVAEMYAEAPRTQIPWDWLRFIGAGSALLRQRLLVAESAQAQPRAERRRLARSGADLSRLHVIRLRKAASQPRPASDETQAVEWSHRWFVRGHWTQQPYGPQQSLRRAQWIMPYIKGPEDKPLKAEAARVFAVNR